jgi:hypothetical protein
VDAVRDICPWPGDGGCCDNLCNIATHKLSPIEIEPEGKSTSTRRLGLPPFFFLKNRSPLLYSKQTSRFSTELPSYKAGTNTSSNTSVSNTWFPETLLLSTYPWRFVPPSQVNRGGSRLLLSNSSAQAIILSASSP